MHKKRRTKEEWEATLEAQEASGLTPREYCAKHHIHLQTFYARKSELHKPRPKSGAKTWVKVSKAEPASPAQPPQLSLHYQGVVINMPHEPAARWLTDVIKGLAS